MDSDINEVWVTEADVTVTGGCLLPQNALPPASSHKASGACLHLRQALSFVLTVQINRHHSPPCQDDKPWSLEVSSSCQFLCISILRACAG